MIASEIDDFASSLLEESKRYLERARECKGTSGETPHLHASLMLAFCALEAHVNAVADEVAQRDQVALHTRALLLEKEVRLEDGVFVLGKNFKMQRLLDRILALHQHGTRPDVKGQWRSALGTAIDLRNKLTHPKEVPAVTPAAVKKALEAVILTLDALYLAVYRRRFPAAHRQLLSSLDFV